MNTDRDEIDLPADVLDFLKSRAPRQFQPGDFTLQQAMRIMGVSRNAAYAALLGMVRAGELEQIWCKLPNDKWGWAFRIVETHTPRK